MQLPYIYMPDDDFKAFSDVIVQQNAGLTCNFESNSCKLSKSCDGASLAPGFLNFDVFDESGS